MILQAVVKSLQINGRLNERGLLRREKKSTYSAEVGKRAESSDIVGASSRCQRAGFSNFGRVANSRQASWGARVKRRSGGGLGENHTGESNKGEGEHTGKSR